MKKALRYTSIVVGIICCLATMGAIASKQWATHREVNRQRKMAADDPLQLPSVSQRLMPLADTLNASQRMALLQQHNLAPLFQIAKKYPAAQNGFLGPTPQRLEVVFTQAIQDARQPGVYQAKGLMRAKGRIQVLKGIIILKEIRHQDEDSKQYTATGTFNLLQYTSSNKPAAVLRGIVAVDFEVAEGRVQLYWNEGAMLRITRGFAFEGTLTAARTKQPQRVVWANNFGPLGSTILEDFGPGGRSEEVAPKYRKYGWDKYWENDEWWADSPKPRLNL